MSTDVDPLVAPLAQIDDDTPLPRRETTRSWRVAQVTALVIVTGIILIALRGVDWTSTGDALRQGRLSWLVFAVLANAAILVCWAPFWRALRPPDEPPVTYNRMFEIVATASALMNTLPFGGGHASSVVLLVRRSGMSARGAVALIALDQLGEGFAKIIIFVLAALLVPLPVWMRAAISTAALVVAVWFVTMVIASRWRRELEIMKRWRQASRALAWVLAMKTVEAIAIWSVQRAYGVNLSVGGTLLILATVVLATMLPIAPGNVGTYEASVFLAYRHLGILPEQALSLAIVQHVCFMLPAIGVGYAFFSAQVARGRG